MGQNELKHSVVFIPFLFREGRAHLLFQERAAGIRQGGEICFPGGIFDGEHDSEASDTALRETQEELGIDSSKLALDSQFHSLITSNGYWIDIFIGRLLVSSLEELNPNPEEVARVFTIPLRELAAMPPKVYPIRITAHGEDRNGQVHFPAEKLNLPERYWNSWDVATRNVYLYKTDDGPIWGITAEILKALLDQWPPII